MRNAYLKSAGIGAAAALLATLAFMLFNPRDFLGWEPVGIWANTVFWPGVKVGVYVGTHWGSSVAIGWAAGSLTMAAIGALLGLMVAVVRRQICALRT